MVDQSFYLRAGQEGALAEGTPGNVLTFQTDGKVKGEPAGGGVVRAQWAFLVTQLFSGTTPNYNIFAGDDPGTFDDVEEGDLLFVPPTFAQQGAFHSSTAAPQFGGVWTVFSKTDGQHVTVFRAPALATAAQIANCALISVEAGSGAGIYQVTTPAAAVVDVDPQVMPQVALPPHEDDGNTYVLTSSGGQSILAWQIGSINSP